MQKNQKTGKIDNYISRALPPIWKNIKRYSLFWTYPTPHPTLHPVTNIKNPLISVGLSCGRISHPCCAPPIPPFIVCAPHTICSFVGMCVRVGVCVWHTVCVSGWVCLCVCECVYICICWYVSNQGGPIGCQHRTFLYTSLILSPCTCGRVGQKMGHSMPLEPVPTPNVEERGKNQEEIANFKNDFL